MDIDERGLMGLTMLNLSLLSSDMWVVLIRIFAHHEKVDWMYFIAVGAVAVGLLVCSGGAKEEGERRIQVAEDDNLQPKERDEKAAVENGVQASIAVGSSKAGDGKNNSSAPNVMP